MSVTSTTKYWTNKELFSPIRLKTPPKPVVKKRRSYSPSWMKKTEMKREQLMSTSQDPFSPRPSEIIATLTTRKSKSPRGLGSSSRHEMLERQYQDLRKMMVERNENQKPGKELNRQQKSATTFPFSSDVFTTNKSVKSTITDYPQQETVTVKEFLQSNEFGSDHFSKHLSCVKSLAKRYRRHRRPKFRAVIEIME